MFKLMRSTRARTSEGGAGAPLDGSAAAGEASPDSPDALRRAADDARDARRWGEAASLYQAYLEREPTDVAIRIQSGNCLKEAGQLGEAHQAYGAALALDPRSADGFLQLGHLLKLMGRRTEMLQAFRTSLDIQPRDNPAFVELMAQQALSAAPSAGASFAASALPLAPVGIFVDVTDLIDYLTVNVSLSGIQRVVSNLVIHAAGYNARSGEATVRFVLPNYHGTEVYELDSTLLANTINAVAVGKSSRQGLDEALAAIKEGRRQVTLKAGDTLVMAGAFWIYPKYDLLSRLRLDGALVTVFIHDLIQISNPEYVQAVATNEFRKSFVDVLSVANYILTNSEYVAQDVWRFLAERMNFQIPVTAVPLATELGFRDTEGAVSPDYLALAQEEYVLCVATIEVRKNHMYLVQLWERLQREFHGDIPNLVFVGKWGWQIEELQKHLHGSDYAGGRLYIFNGIPDRDLAFLYEHCLFTVYSSFAEGWGLPVGESLGYGKLCVASNVTSIPEVGGALCRYFDPFNLDTGYAVVAGLLGDRPALETLTRRIRDEFRPKTWRDFSDEIFHLIERRREERGPSGRSNNCLIETGHVVTLGNDPLLQLDLCKRRLLTARMARVSGWHGLEAWGCWAAKRRAVLAFSTNLPAGTAIDVYIQLKTADLDECAECLVTVGGVQTLVDELGSVPSWCTAYGVVGPDGMVDVVLLSGRGFFHRHGRDLFIGLISLAVAPSGDAETEAKILRQILRRGTVAPVRERRGEASAAPPPMTEMAHAEAL